MMLDRIGDEVARATTIVRFAPGSAFDAHTHSGGEEFLVLDGVFSDETGDFPKGSYVRNPIGTRHRPHTDQGCTIFVKLHQFSAEDQKQVHIPVEQSAFLPGPVPGIEVLHLHDFGTEHVQMVRFAAGAHWPAQPVPAGAELLVVEGAVTANGETWPHGSWLRLPAGSMLELGSETGGLIYLKTGHLPA